MLFDGEKMGFFPLRHVIDIADEYSSAHDNYSPVHDN